MASYACSLLPFEATRSYGKSSPAHQEVSETGHAASMQAKTPFLLYAFVSARRAGCRLLAMRTPRGVAECGNSTCSPNDRHVDSVRRRWGGGGTPTALPAIKCLNCSRAWLQPDGRAFQAVKGNSNPSFTTETQEGTEISRRHQSAPYISVYSPW